MSRGSPLGTSVGVRRAGAQGRLGTPEGRSQSLASDRGPLRSGPQPRPQCQPRGPFCLPETQGHRAGLRLGGWNWPTATEATLPQPGRDSRPLSLSGRGSVEPPGGPSQPRSLRPGSPQTSGLQSRSTGDGQCGVLGDYHEGTALLSPLGGGVLKGLPPKDHEVTGGQWPRCAEMGTWWQTASLWGALSQKRRPVQRLSEGVCHSQGPPGEDAPAEPGVARRPRGPRGQRPPAPRPRRAARQGEPLSRPRGRRGAGRAPAFPPRQGGAGRRPAPGRPAGPGAREAA